VNAGHRRTLEAIFSDSVARTLLRRRVENLLVAVGFRVIEGNGSRVRFEKDGIVGTFHRPHPEKDAKPYQIRDARRLLQSLGIEP
jgi:predicted RNA binding protein YcfA (HicA-like mRNA interferase family)